MSKTGPRPKTDGGSGPSLPPAHAASVDPSPSEAELGRDRTAHAWMPLSSFVGRDADLDRLEALLGQDRLLTLVGPGGTGKTRLALALAARMGRPDGLTVRVVELASISESELVPAVIARVVQAGRTPGRPAMDLVVETLSKGPSLLVLDNLEQLEGVESIVRELLVRCPDLRIVATSRRPLRISGEHRYEVGPLALPQDSMDIEHLSAIESVALFVARARSVLGSFELTDDNAAAVAAICRRVDGLPLAIELAAARLGVLSPAALLARLDARLATLIGGPVDAPDRQRTLRDTIAWSHDLLAPREAAVFERASVFVGGFTEDAAAAVVRDDHDPEGAAVLAMLGTLVEHSLLRASPGNDGEPRFDMLETIRELAAERLTAPDDARARHADYYVTFAETAERSLGGPHQATWAPRVAADIDNIRAALRWLRSQERGELMLRLASAMGEWYRMGVVVDLREGRRWLDDALAIGEGAAPRLRAKALRWAARLSEHLGRRDEHDRLIQDAQQTSEVAGDDYGVAEAMLFHASALMDRGESQAAYAVVEAALAPARRSRDERLVARIELRRAISGAADTHAFIKVVEESIGELRRKGEHRELAISLLNLSFAYISIERIADALAALAEASPIFEQLGERAFLGVVRLHEALARLRLGEFETSRRLSQQGMAIAGDVAFVDDMLYSVEVAADWLGSAGLHTDAVELWSAVASFRARMGLDLFPIDRIWIEGSQARDERALRPAARAAASAAGAALDLEAALERAKELLETAIIPAEPGSDPGRPDEPFPLTPRETEVLGLLVDGYSDKAIADELFISPKTASVHVANIKGKLGASSRVEIATMAMRRGLAAPTRDERPF